MIYGAMNFPIRPVLDEIHAIDFAVLIEALQKLPYDDTMTLEIFTPDLADLVRSRNILQKMRNHHLLQDDSI